MRIGTASLERFSFRLLMPVEKGKESRSHYRTVLLRRKVKKTPLPRQGRFPRGGLTSRLRSKRRLVVDRVEGVLRELLHGLDLAVPEAAASVRSAGSVPKHLQHCHAARTAEGRA